MLDRPALQERYTLSPPAEESAMREAEAAMGLPLPPAYRLLLSLSNGLASSGRLMVLDIESLAARNADYEVQIYMPGWIMIGDDGGGAAILLKGIEPTVFEVGMGVMDAGAVRASAPSLEHLLLVFQGRTLGERA